MTKKIKSILLLMIFVVSFSISNYNVKAEALGGKWNQQIIYIYYNSDIESPYWLPELSDELDSAMMEWNDVFIWNDIDMFYLRTLKEDEADIIVNFDTVIQGLANGIPGPNPYAGIYEYGSLTVDHKKIYDTYRFDSKLAQILKATYMHELGHLLGLAHTTTSEPSIMKSTINKIYDLTEPTTYDINSVKSIYN